MRELFQLRKEFEELDVTEEARKIAACVGDEATLRCAKGFDGTGD